jgi:hypothetical protein
LAQEAEDHQAIRTLFQREQEGWRNGDGAQVLSCYAKNYVGYNVPLRNNQLNFLQVNISGSYESGEKWLLADDFVGMKADLADSALAFIHKYELNHIDVKGNEGVAATAQMGDVGDLPLYLQQLSLNPLLGKSLLHNGGFIVMRQSPPQKPT